MESCKDERYKSVLTVEDDETIHALLSETLRDEGFDVYAAENRPDGLKIIDTIPRLYLTLLDFMMPVMNGREFMEKKQHDDLFAPIPVVPVSAFENRPRSIGAVGFIRKPIEFDCMMKFLIFYCNEKNNVVENSRIDPVSKNEVSLDRS